MEMQKPFWEQSTMLSYISIPEGSVLGPSILVLYANEMPKVMQSIIKLYACDTKLFWSIQECGELFDITGGHRPIASLRLVFELAVAPQL